MKLRGRRIRAKEGSLSIPLYVGGETQAQTDAAAKTAATALPDALSQRLESSAGNRSNHSFSQMKARL